MGRNYKEKYKHNSPGILRIKYWETYFNMAISPIKQTLLFVYPSTNSIWISQINELIRTTPHKIHLVSDACRPKNLSSQVSYTRLKKLTLGVDMINKILPLEIPVPAVYLGLRRFLNKVNPTTVVVMDFYNPYFFQIRRYITATPSTKLFLYTEFKQLPSKALVRYLTRAYIALTLKALSRLDGLICLTKQGQNFWRKKGLTNTHVCEAGISPISVPAKVRRPFLERGQLKILVPARMVPFKRHIDILHAFEILKRKELYFSATFIDDEGVFSRKIRRLTCELGLQSYISFIHTVQKKEMKALYRSHDVIVLASDNEALGLVVPESMANGTPTITSDSVGANTYVRPGSTGLIFRTGDRKDLAYQLEKLFDKSLLEQFHKSSIREIRKYTGQSIGQKLNRILFHG
ncbi:glycosyltransferase [Candidatus Dojkabacteria bacterium]|nr:glycosyltransferase [Candidatus Dojkabacteria bacterium]